MPFHQFSICEVFLRKSNFQFSIKKGFTFIELLVVITIFGLTASLVTASYLTFERNQRLKNAALTLKNELRLIQNRALSGDKAPPSDPESCYSKEGILVGWYLKISTH